MNTNYIDRRGRDRLRTASVCILELEKFPDS